MYITQCLRLTSTFIVLMLHSLSISAQEIEIVAQYGHNADIKKIAIHPLEQRMVSLDTYGRLIEWDMDSKVILDEKRLEVPGFMQSGSVGLKYAPNGKRLVFNTHDFFSFKMSAPNRSLTIYDTEKNEVASSIKQEADFIYGKNKESFIFINEHVPFQGTQVLKNSYLLKYNHDDSGQNQLVNQLSFDYQHRISTISYSEKHDMVFVGFFNGEFKAISADDFSVVWEEQDFKGAVMHIRTSANRVAIAGKTDNVKYRDGNHIVLRDASTGKLVKKLAPTTDRKDENFISLIEFSPDGKYLTAISQFYFFVWDVHSQKLLYNHQPAWYFPATQIQSLNDFAFLPGRNEVVVASNQSLFTFDIENKVYSSNFNQQFEGSVLDLEEELHKNNQYMVFDSRNKKLDLYDLNKLDRRSYNLSFAKSLLDEVNNKRLPDGIDYLTFPALHGGNIIDYHSKDSLYYVWAAPSGDYDLNTNYFLSFKLGNWELQEVHGPYQWGKKKDGKYTHLIHFEADRGWFLMRSNLLDMGNHLGQQNFTSSEFSFLNSRTGKELLSIHADIVNNGVSFSPDHHHFAFLDKEWNLRIYETKSFKEVYRAPVDRGSNTSPFLFRNNNSLIFANNSKKGQNIITDVMEVDLNSYRADTLLPLSFNTPTSMAIHEDYLAIGLSFDLTKDKWKDSVDINMEKYGLSYFLDYNVVVIDLSNNEIVGRCYNNKNYYFDITLNEKLLLARPFNQPLEIHPLIDMDKKVAHMRKGNDDIFFTEEFYSASKNALNALGVVIENQGYPIRKFDILYNRPDKILEFLGVSTPSFVRNFNQAYKKRLERNQLNINDLAAGFSLDDIPQIELTNEEEVGLVTTERELELRLDMSDSLYGLKSWHLIVNGVPLFAQSGKKIESKPGEKISIKASINLNSGLNSIQAFARNKQNRESLAINRKVRFENETPNEKQNIYIITIGVSDYTDDRYDLKYAAKDAIDLQKMFYSKDTIYYSEDDYSVMNNWNFPNEFFDQVEHLQLTDKQVTRKNFLKLKDKLMNSNVDDIVLIFLAGHGLLDDKNNYYYATHDIDFSNPSERGISFNDINSILEGIPARKRALFMDTCNSGEVDQSTKKVLTDSQEKPDQRIVANLKRGAAVTSATEEQGPDSFEVMKSLFADFNTTGTVIISASSGTGFALENDEWQNGIFTYSVVQGLKNFQADKDQNAKISITELRDYVIDQVEVMTNGRQKPTSRQENLEVDFALWSR